MLGSVFELRRGLRVIPLAVLAVLLAPTPAPAQRIAPVAPVATPTARVVKSGAVSANKTYDVSVPGGRMKVGDLADKLLAAPRRRGGELAKAKSALLAPAVESESFTETDSATVIEHTVSFTVTDPAGLRAAAPSLKSYQATTSNRGTLSAASLKGEQRAGFDAFKADIAKKPANHPLKQALAKGDDALLDAVAAGKDDVTIRTKVTVPKVDPVITGNTWKAPRFVNGTFDFGQTVTKTLKSVPNMGKIGGSLPMIDLTPEPEGTGNSKGLAKFLTGFTKSKAFDWDERWEFGRKDYFEIGVHASYAVGLRVPVEVTYAMTPASMSYTGTEDVSGKYEVSLSARPLDASKSFYEETGLKSSELFDGKELVFEAEAYATVDVRAGWGAVNIHEQIPKNAGFDFSQHMKPPYDDCGTSCGVDVWIPASVTNTELNILGIVKGSAQVGVNLGGSGSVGFDYTSLSGSDTVSSVQAGDTKTTHNLTFKKASVNKKVTTTLDALPKTAGTARKSYGFKLANPTYTWDLELTPGVKGTVEVNAKPFFELEEVIGPFWLNAASVDLGSVTFKAHEGTKSVVELKKGMKTFTFSSPAKSVAIPAKR